MKVIIVDDNITFQESLKYFLENTFSYEVIGTANDGEEYLKFKNFKKADMIFMDINMPNLNGIETVKKALWEYQFLKFIAITNYTHRAYLQELIGAGFKACVFKNSIYDELEKAINAVSKNQLYFPNDIIIKTSI
jgi:NarL family two-component system response regulator YdfI